MIHVVPAAKHSNSHKAFPAIEEMSASCRPPAGHTYLTIGQDLFSIQEYLNAQYNASLHRGSIASRSSFAPAAVMVYTDIQTLRGLDAPADYGSGVEFADGLLDEFDALQVGLWLNGTQGCRDIVNGALDAQIHSFMQYLQHCRATRVFLRVGYEFDNPSFGYDEPTYYRRAFWKLVDACENRNKVKFVWHSWGAKRQMSLQDYYPGDSVVDWVGVSIFRQVLKGGSLTHVWQVLDFAATHDKVRRLVLL